METLIVVLHTLVSALLILMVLIQGGEGVDITAAFGGVSQAAFGPRGAVTTLTKITWVLACIFMATSITLSIMATKHSGGTVLQNAPSKSAPAAPAPAPAVPATK
jgi:preprotein translocase subunit SecG